jgi:hypothetical protein
MLAVMLTTERYNTRIDPLRVFHNQRVSIMGEKKLYYTAKESCEALGITKQTWVRWIQEEKHVYDYTTMIGRTRVITKENMNRFLNGLNPVKQDFEA